MNLQALQINLLDLVKSRTDINSIDDAYLRKVALSDNLVLAKRIVLWWRQLQIQNYCVLTTNLLKSYSSFGRYTQQFTSEKFSVFNEEVGGEFIDFINSCCDISPLVRSVSTFERALIRSRTGYIVDETIPWQYEPYAVIQALLNNAFNEAVLQPGNYEIKISNQFENGLFEVHEISGDL